MRLPVSVMAIGGQGDAGDFGRRSSVGSVSISVPSVVPGYELSKITVKRGADFDDG